jgi:hypothetical protein
MKLITKKENLISDTAARKKSEVKAYQYRVVDLHTVIKATRIEK